MIFTWIDLQGYKIKIEAPTFRIAKNCLKQVQRTNTNKNEQKKNLRSK